MPKGKPLTSLVIDIRIILTAVQHRFIQINFFLIHTCFQRVLLGSCEESLVSALFVCTSANTHLHIHMYISAGFPHRGFPLEVEELVLKAKGISKLTVRPGLGLPPADFVENLRQLRSQWGPTLSAEQAMSSLLYPKVFADYMARTAKKGWLACRMVIMYCNVQASFNVCARSIAALPADDGVSIWLAARSVLSDAGAQCTGCQTSLRQDRVQR